MYKLYIVSENEEEVISKLSNLIAARGLSILTIYAQPLNDRKTLSSLEITLEIPENKVANLREKLLQIVPIREVRVFKITEVIFE